MLFKLMRNQTVKESLKKEKYVGKQVLNINEGNEVLHFFTNCKVLLMFVTRI